MACAEYSVVNTAGKFSFRECLSILHSSWIFSIDNEWIFVVIMKPGPDFGTRILGPQLFSETTTEGSRILDSGFRDLSRASSTCFAVLDSGFSGRKSRLISIELKSQLFSLQLERWIPDLGSWILPGT